MAYNNPYYYNRSSSVKQSYSYVDLTKFSPIYGSSVDYVSRLNILPTSDNTLKILPASENNLSIKFKLIFLLSDADTGDLLKTIEKASGTDYLSFKDSSGVYKNMIGYVEDYSVDKNTNANLNQVTIILSSYTSSPLFNWKSSSLLNAVVKTYVAQPTFLPSEIYSKYDIVYMSNNIIGSNAAGYDLIKGFDANQPSKDNVIYYVNDQTQFLADIYFESKKANISSFETFQPQASSSTYASKIFLLKSLNEVIYSYTNGTTTFLVQYNYNTKTNVQVGQFYNYQSSWFSFKNANEIFVIKTDEKVSYMSNATIGSNRIASYIQIYKYNFSLQRLDQFAFIEPILSLPGRSTTLPSSHAINSFLNQNAHNSVYEYSLEPINLSSCCFSNNVLYFAAKMRYKSGNATLNFNVIIGFNVVTKIQTLHHIRATNEQYQIGITNFSVDPLNSKIYLTLLNSDQIFATSGLVSSATIFNIQNTGFITIGIKDLYVKNDVIYTVYEKQTNRFPFINSTSLLMRSNKSKTVEFFDKNPLNRFYIAKNDVTSFSDLTKDFFFETKLSFSLKNKFDFKQLDSKNSFIQNVKYKENENTLKQFNLKYENISTKQCLAMLFFLEKKCGYRRFKYDFPIFLNTKKVFICTEWSHTFKYHDCHDLNLLFIEDPNPNIFVPPDGSSSTYELL